MLKKPWKRKFILVFVAIFIFAINSMAFAEGTDLENHWAKTEIEYLIEKGIVSGYNDGTFKPDKEITRAEFIKIINNVFGYSEKSEISFNDVKESEWHYEDIQKGVAAGYIGGYSDGTMKPNKPITRQEVAKIIAIAYDLDRYTSVSSKSFIDSDSIDEWAKNYIGIMKDKELITGYSDGSFSPKKNVTRGEIAKIVYRASGEIVNNEGVYNEDIDGNIVVNVSNVYLKNMTVRRDLYLAEGIGEGSVSLEGVNVEGNMFIRGGGQNSIKIGNCNINNIIINKPANIVRVLLKENAKVSSIAMERNGKVVVESGAKVGNVVAFGHSNIEVQSGGNISSIEVAGKNVVINSKGNIENVVANEEVSINGTMLAKGSQAKVEGGKVKVKGEKPSDTPATPSTGGGGGGSYTGGGGSYTGGGGSGNGGTGGEDTPTPSIVDKKALNEKIAEAEKLKQIDYTEVSWANLQNALNSAKAIAGKANATQTEVDKALNDLVNAINNLVEATEVKAVLEFTPDEILNEGFKLGKAKVYVVGIPNADKYSIKYTVENSEGNVTKYVNTRIAKIGEENPDLIQIGENTVIEICIYDFNNKVILSLSSDMIEVVVK